MVIATLMQIHSVGSMRDGRYSPIALSATALLGLGRVGVLMSLLGEVARKPRLTLSGAVGNAGVVTVSELVGASHFLMSVPVDENAAGDAGLRKQC